MRTNQHEPIIAQQELTGYPAQREWVTAILRREPHRSRAALQRTGELMDRAVLDALVTEYQSIADRPDLPDINDRHVLAAVIVGGCDVILTKNLRHFPSETLAAHDVVAERPDPFLAHLLGDATPRFLTAVAKVRSRLSRPAVGIGAYLHTLEVHGLEATVAKLRPFSEHL